MSDDSINETQKQDEPVSEISNALQALLRKSPERSILDLNWISSSDDDSFVRDLGHRPLLSKEHPSTAQFNETRRDLYSDAHPRPINQGSLLRLVLLSSPTHERSERILSTLPSSLQKRLNEILNGAQIPLDVSDPIEVSSPRSSPRNRPKRNRCNLPERSVKAKTDGFSTKEWNTVNKAVRSKAEVMAEMIIEIALCVHCKVKTAYFRERFVGLNVRDTFEELPIISWKRRAKAIYDRKTDLFVPCDLTELKASFYCLVYEGPELIYKIRDGVVLEDLQKLKKRANFENPGSSPHVVILVPGFQEYLNKLRSAEEREYRRKMLAQMNGADSIQKGKKSGAADILAEEALRIKVETEVKLGVNIHTCKDIRELVDWLYTFTYTLGTSIYDNRERNGGYANFGRVKLGKDKTSTFLLMLQNFNLVTAPKAQHIFQFYASPLSLYNRYMEENTLGSFTANNEVKPIVSATINTAMRRVFSSKDPNMVITD